VPSSPSLPLQASQVPTSFLLAGLKQESEVVTVLGGERWSLLHARAPRAKDLAADSFTARSVRARRERGEARRRGGSFCGGSGREGGVGGGRPPEPPLRPGEVAHAHAARVPMLLAQTDKNYLRQKRVACGGRKSQSAGEAGCLAWGLSGGDPPNPPCGRRRSCGARGP
jgi:hypothetical protein